MPGNKLSEMLSDFLNNAQAAVKTGLPGSDLGPQARQLVFGPERNAEMSDAEKAMFMLQQMAPGGMQTASLSALIASPAFKDLSPAEQAVVQYLHKVLPRGGEVAKSTTVVPPSEWEAALAARRTRAGLGSKTIKAEGTFYPGGNDIMVRGLKAGEMPHSLGERLAHEIRHAITQARLVRDQYGGKLAQYLKDISEGPARKEMAKVDESISYPFGWAARRRIQKIGGSAETGYPRELVERVMEGKNLKARMADLNKKLSEGWQYNKLGELEPPPPEFVNELGEKVIP